MKKRFRTANLIFGLTAPELAGSEAGMMKMEFMQKVCSPGRI